jgi:hypothetical protein
MTRADDRRKDAYLLATDLDQAELDETFLGGENEIEFIGTLVKTVTIGFTVTVYTLRFADRPKYVGDDFYEGRATFPKIFRTIGELQAPSIKFSELEVQLANMDGFYNQYLEGGASYFSFIGAELTIKMGLRDVAASFKTIFQGTVPEDGGSSVSRTDITIHARDKFDALNRRVPLPVINDVDFPSAPQDSFGKMIPFALGDWEHGYNFTADAKTVSAADGSGGSNDVKADSPNNFAGGLIGYNVGGGFFVFSVGTYTPDNAAEVHIKRGDDMLQTDFDTTPVNTAGYWSIMVNGLIDTGAVTVPYVYQSGDIALIKIKVPYAVGEYSNFIKIAREILYELGDRVSGDLHASSWNTLIAKATPAQSDFTTLKGRIWIGNEKDTVLGSAIGILEGVRVEMYIDRDGLIHLSTLHPEDFPAPGSATRVDQIELSEADVKQDADDRTFFNEAQINYSFTPATGKTALATGLKKNANSQTLSGKRVAKSIDCPWLYIEADANYQLIEFLRFYSAGLSYITVPMAWVHLRRDLGEFLSINYNIGSLSYTEAPMQIRDTTIDPGDCSVEKKLLSLHNFAYTGYDPDNSDRFLSGASQGIVDV